MFHSSYSIHSFMNSNLIRRSYKLNLSYTSVLAKIVWTRQEDDDKLLFSNKTFEICLFVFLFFDRARVSFGLPSSSSWIGAGQSSDKWAAAAAAAALMTDELILRVDLAAAAEPEPERFLRSEDELNNLLSFSSDTFIRRGFGVLKIERFSANWALKMTNETVNLFP